MKESRPWRVGDWCLAPYSGDEALYRAVIRKLGSNAEGQQLAEVCYDGFSAEENECVRLEDLRRRKTTSSKTSPKAGARTESSESSSHGFDSPLLQYMSEEDRIRAQYADIYDDPSPHRRLTTSSPAGERKSAARRGSKLTQAAQKRKGTVAFGGEAKGPAKKNEENSSRKTITASSTTHCTSGPRDTTGHNLQSFDHWEAFSDGDVEKPLFPGKSDVSAKDPLILSNQPGCPVIQVPSTMNRYLRAYQREGVQFLYEQYKKDKGAILGDDMGLGKTVQVIAFIAALLGKTGGKEDLERKLPEFLQKESPKKSDTRPTKTFLIICPNSVLYNWLDEFETWTHCIIGKYHGKERDETLKKARRGRLDAVVTTYEMYRLYLDDMLTVHWDAVFVDEVHKIKEPAALITQALKKVNTNKRYGLTGTALQNKMGELWCVLDWANPGCLGTWWDFKQEYEKVITTGQKYNASKRELADARKVAKRFSHLRSRWLLRRTKALIAHQLPTKDENVVFCNLSPFQLDVYRALLESEDMKLVLRQREPCDCGRDRKRGKCCYYKNERGEGIKSLTFGLMSLLIKVSNHVALLTPDATMSAKQREKARRYCEVAFSRQPQFVELSREARFATLSDPAYCGKMQVLAKLLRVFKRENSKILLFSCYTQLLDILEMYLKTTFYTYRRLDGKTPTQDRLKYVQEFNKDPDIFLFLISTKAGGIGLNLTGANVVIIFDPNWNPTYDLQAQDRAYRIGQHRDVRVYRLVSRGSIEENMYLRQLYKQQLASVAVTTENAKRYFTAVAGDGKQQGEIYGLHNLFALRVDGSCQTREVIEREEKTELGISVAKYRPPPSGEESNEDPIDKLLDTNADGRDDEEENEDNNDDDNDTHGMASQLDDISDDSHSDLDEAPNSKVRRLQKSSKKHHNQSGAKDGDQCDQDEKEDDDDLDEEEEDGERGNGWRTELKTLTRGKAILGKDGQPIRKVKGQMAKSRSEVRRGSASPMKRSPGVTKHAGISNDGRGSDDADGEENFDNVQKMDKDGEGRRMDKAVKNDRQEGKQLLQRRESGSTDTAEDVFRKCRVRYIHSNQKVVGASRVEDYVSEVAQRDVFEIGQFTQEPAYCQVPTLQMESLESEPEAEPVTNQRTASVPRLTSRSSSHHLGETTVLVGQTPIALKKDQFQDMASVLGFNYPSALASHIQSLSDEACLKLLLSYYKTKHGVGFDEFIQLPASSKASTGRGTREDGAGTRGRGRGRGRGGGRKGSSGGVTRGKVKDGGGGTSRGRQSSGVGLKHRRAAEGLRFIDDDDDDGDVGMEMDTDEGEGVVAESSKEESGGGSVGRGSRTMRRRGRGRRRRNDMRSHEAYQELFGDSSEDEMDIMDVIDSILHKNPETESRQHQPQDAKLDRKEVKESHDNVSEVTPRCSEIVEKDENHLAQLSESVGQIKPKKEQSLSFLDEIFLTDSRTTKRKPPPKHGRQGRAVVTATSESESLIAPGSVPSDDSFSLFPSIKLVKEKYLDDSLAPTSTMFTKARVSCDPTFDKDASIDESAGLWKRNSTFVPRQIYFDEDSDCSQSSESLFVANPKFRSGTTNIT